MKPHQQFRRSILICQLALAALELPVAAAQSVNEYSNPKIRAGWFASVPHIPGYVHSFAKPVVAKNGYYQNVRYEWTGNAMKVAEVMLAKGKFERENENRNDNRSVMQLRGVKTVQLGGGKSLTIRTYGLGPWEPIGEFIKHFDLKKISAALDKPPRTCFDLTRSGFAAIGKGTRFADAIDWVGDPVSDIGSGIHIMTYPLKGGGEARIGTPDCKEVMYVQFSQ